MININYLDVIPILFYFMICDRMFLNIQITGSLVLLHSHKYY